MGEIGTKRKHPGNHGRKYTKKNFGNHVAAASCSTAESAVTDLLAAIERLQRFQKSLVDRIDVTAAVGQLRALQLSMTERIDESRGAVLKFHQPSINPGNQ